MPRRAWRWSLYRNVKRAEFGIEQQREANLDVQRQKQEFWPANAPVVLSRLDSENDNITSAIRL